jgi:hypothetical protein
VRRKPALSRRTAYSASVRSWPSVITSMVMSSNLPGCGASPGGKHHLDKQQAAVGLNDFAAMAQNEAPRYFTWVA